MCKRPMKEITKLRNKTEKARNAIKAIYDCQILQKLEQYNPTVVSTILVGLDTDDSDIDIICSYNQSSVFFKDTKLLISNCFNGICKKKDNYVIAQFQYAGFLFEIFGTDREIESQMAFRHYQVMKRLSQIGRTNFQNAVRAIKKTGIKTEPAIASILQLKGDPYESILLLEQLKDTELARLLH